LAVVVFQPGERRTLAGRQNGLIFEKAQRNFRGDSIPRENPKIHSPEEWHLMRLPIFNRTQFRTQSPDFGFGEIAGILMAVCDFKMVRAAGFEPATPSV
jgi:hypothetical protein